MLGVEPRSKKPSDKGRLNDLEKGLITLDKSRLGEHYMNGIAALHSRIVQQHQHSNLFANFDHSYI